MKYKIYAAACIGVLIAAFVPVRSLIHNTRQQEQEVEQEQTPERSGTEGQEQKLDQIGAEGQEKEQEQEPERSGAEEPEAAARKESPAPSPEKPFSIKSGKAAEPETGKATEHYNYVYKDELLWVSGTPYADKDQPRIELRFVEPDGAGNMKPRPLRAIRMVPWDVDNNQQRPPKDGELFGLSFVGMEPHQGIGEALRIRTLISHDDPCSSFNGLLKGKTYYLKSEHPGFENDHVTPEKWGGFFLKVPREVPAGKVAVFDIDVTLQHNPYDTQARTVSLKINGRVPDDPVAVISSPGGSVQPVRIARDGSGERTVTGLGGELMVGVGQSMGYCLYYTGAIEDQEVAFPADADVATKEEDMISFNLEVPGEKLPEDAMALALFAGENSQLPLAWSHFTPVTALDPAARRELPETVQMEYMPGDYYLGYMKGRKGSTLGLVRIREEDSGRTVEF